MFISKNFYDTATAFQNIRRAADYINLFNYSNVERWMEEYVDKTYVDLFLTEDVINVLNICMYLNEHYREYACIDKFYLPAPLENVFWLIIAHQLQYINNDLVSIKNIDYHNNGEASETMANILTMDQDSKYEFVFVKRRHCTSFEYQNRTISNIIGELEEGTFSLENLSTKSKFYDNDNIAHYYKVSERLFIRIKNNKYRYILLSKIGDYYSSNPIRFNERTLGYIEKFKHIIFPFNNDGDLIELYDPEVYYEEVDSIIGTIYDLYEKKYLYDVFSRDNEKYRLNRKYEEYKIKINNKLDQKNNYQKQLSQIAVELKLLEEASKTNTKKESDRVIALLERYKKFNLLKTYYLEEYDDRLNIVLETKPVQIQFFEDFRARSWMANINTTIQNLESILNKTDRDKQEISYWKNLKELVKKVLDGEDYKLFMTPHTAVITLTENTINFRTISSTSVLFENNNQHACYSNGSGCRGTFNEEFNLYSKTYEVEKFLRLYFQYIQSINPTDPIGHYAFERAYVTNKDNIIISGSIPEISSGKVGYLLIGKNIYEAFDNIREYEKMFKEDKLAPDYSQLENEPNVYRRNAEDLGLPF